MATRVWTMGRKWAGNLAPLVVWLPPTLLGVLDIAQAGAVTARGLFLLIGGTVVGWVTLALLGFWSNSAMKKALAARVKDKGDRWFVGFASPTFSGLLDAHEDVGFLVMSDRVLIFAGDSKRVELDRDQIVRVVFRPNVHTIVGLGRWVSVEGLVKGQPVRLLVEPREHPTMIGNLGKGRTLKRAIEAWAGLNK